MIEKIKNASLAIFVFLFIPTIIIMFLRGGLWFFSKYAETLGAINLSLFSLSIVLLICSLYPNFRNISGLGLIIASWFIGGTFWLFALYLTYSLLGVIWMIFGLFFAGMGVVPLAGFALLLHKEFLTFGLFALAGIFIFAFRFVGMWIISRFRVVKPIKNSVLRYAASIIFGPIIGSAISLPIFAILNTMLGIDINTTTSPLSFILILYMNLIGLITGFSAAIISQKRGKTIAIFAQFAPLIFIIVISIIFNRDLTTAYEVPPAIWTWIGLIPAIIGGHFGEKYIRSEILEMKEKELPVANSYH